MKKFALAGFALLGLISASTVRAEDVVRFGLAAEPYPPFSVKDSAGNWIGWEMDLRDAVCAEMKAQCVTVEVAWDGIIPALLEKKFDVIWSSMSITDERKKVIAFTDKYYTSAAVWVGAKSDTRTFETTNPGSMDGVLVGAQNATTHASYMQKYFKDHSELKLYDTLDNGTADLKAGRIDLLMAGAIQIADWLKSPDGADYEIKVKVPHDPLFGYGDGAGLRQEDTGLRDRLNAAISAVRASGKYQQITAKYFAFDIYE